MKNFTFLFISAFLLASLLTLHPARLLAQSYQLPLTGMASYTTCTGTLYDDGGPTDPYDSNASGGVTLRPGTPGSKLRLDFTLLEVDSVNLSLLVYDGPDTNSPLIDRLYNGKPTVYATGSTGALTVVLRSYGLPRRGFAAAISCVTGPPPAPDPAVLSVELKPALVPAGDYFSLKARVANLVGGVANYRLRFLLSTDTKVDAADQELARTDSYLAAGAAGSYWQQPQLPGNTAPGTYYVLCAAQLLDTTPEANTTNNLAYARLTVPPATAIPDLTVTTLGYDGPARLGAGSILYASTRVQNLGRTLAQSSEVGYYFSADATLSSDDQLLGRATAPVATDGKYTVVYTTLRLPAVVAPGPYYLLAVADHLDLVIEANEQNNTFALPLLVQPPSIDLAFGQRRLLSNTQPGAGGRLEVTCTLQNEGSALLDSAAVGYFLSADRQLSADDVLLGRATAGPLSPGDSYYGRVVRTLTIPAGTPPGPHYLLLVADYRNQVLELDETNNVAPLPLELVEPNVDLTITAPRNGSVYAPTVGTAFYARCTLTNRGTTAAYPGAVAYFFSTDAQLSADDQLLSESPALTLAGGGSQVVETTFSLPANVAPGPYYLLFVADNANQVAEADETNNSASLAIQVENAKFDLTLATNFAVAPARAPAGTALKVACAIGNDGATPAYEPAVGYYLSADDKLSADDLLIGSSQLFRNSVYPTATATLTGSVVVPRPTPPGRYYVLGVADYLDAFAETDETNNVRAAALEVTATQPDLAALANPYVAPRQVLAGASASTESYVNNVGAGPARASQLGYYLSADPTLGPDDVLLGSTGTTEIAAGASALVAGTLTVPATTATGRYYVLFVADHLNQVNDVNLTNNVSYSTISVQGALAAREQLAGYELRVLPVPVASPAPLRVQLSGPSLPAAVTLTLYNGLGQAVATRRLLPLPGGGQADVPTTSLAAGMYVLRLSGAGLSAARRVVVE